MVEFIMVCFDFTKVVECRCVPNGRFGLRGWILMSDQAQRAVMVSLMDSVQLIHDI